MGNHRFRLSDMIPNAWFYKLKDMSKTKNNTKTKHLNSKKVSPTKTVQTQPKNQQFSNPRHSYYFTTDPFKAEKLYSSPINRKSTDTQFPPFNPPRKSSRRRRRNKISAAASIKYSSPRISSGGCSFGSNFDSTPDNSIPSQDHQNLYEFILKSKPVSNSDPFDESWSSSWSSSCSCRISTSTNDIIIDMDDSEYDFDKKLNGFELTPKLELPPILTKPLKFSDMVSEIKNREVAGTLSEKVSKEGRRIKNVKEQRMGLSSSSSLSVRKSVSSCNSSPGMKLRSNSPKIASRKIQSRKMAGKTSTTGSRLSRSSNDKTSVSDSFAVVKSSFDPQRDFYESMVEMILENNLRATNDLEELLACYLSLNSNEYHDLIVQVFEQIWFDLTDSKL
ncbi:hypothetical protein C5167_045339 [Papaver somniferum]|uniref:Transcription repressor n=1 Tax=Papaver somniferum TaxID=3469 RepID=A0A4Y7LCY5_PAPSO|nr:transcription repressor OFP1-like [Papaver somniferum]RZC82552.1 hypothetical protein C5167_045339 [Papaver somniferum]